MSENLYSVKLVSVASFNQGMGSERVVFDASPSFNENRSVIYTQVSPVHLPGDIQIYRNTKSRTFSVGAKLVSRTRPEAIANMKRLQMLRGWTMPYFGKQDNPALANQTNISGAKATGLLGAPPDVLYLWAYSAQNTGNRPSFDSANQISLTNINKVPVVLTSLGITYPQNVTYIHTSDNNTSDPFPVIIEIALELAETHSPIEYEQFSLQQFKNGSLEMF